MKRIVRISVAAVLVVAAVLLGGSFYMLSYSLRPDRVMAEKNADSYKYMYEEYPFLEPWVDSLTRAGACAIRRSVIPTDCGFMPSMPRRPARRTVRP